jgi:NTP pyrophosphatase (non-canonical NTP hydrolase)
MIPEHLRTHSFKEWQGAIHAWAIRKGWRNEDGTPSRTFGDDIALIHSEASEALEAYRDHGLDRFVLKPNLYLKLQFEQGTPYPVGDKPEGVASELADILIRVLDCAEEYGFDMDYEVKAKMAYNERREYRHGGKSL